MSWLWVFPLIFFTLFYVILAVLLRAGIKRKYSLQINKNIPVSIIVAARNEARYIKRCLESLNHLDYPKEFLEIIVVDDRSEDNTRQIIIDYIKDKPQFKYLRNENSQWKLSGKASAISKAINNSQGEILFVTDADCVVTENWITKTVGYFDHDVGMVAGFALLNNDNHVFSKLQAMDWVYLLSVAAGALGLGIPLSCIGNNFAIRRSVYDEVGGYEGVGFSLTEDFALLHAVAFRTGWQIRFPVDRECLVFSKGVDTLHDFFAQRKRWALGGKSVHWFGKLLIFASVITHCFLFMLLFIKFVPALIGLISVLSADYWLICSTANKLRLKGLNFYLIPYKFFSFFYMIILAFILLFDRNVVWKGIKYSIYQSD